MKRNKLDKALAIALPNSVPSQPKVNLASLADRIPLEKRSRKADLPDRGEHSKQSLDKHGGSLRYKAAYAADLLAEDIISVFKRSGKKDKEYLKGLVWSFGVLFDKATGGVSSDAISVRIPAKLLENVNAVIAIQVGKKLEQTKTQDTQSCDNVIESRACEVVVADTVADKADSKSKEHASESAQPPPP